MKESKNKSKKIIGIGFLVLETALLLLFLFSFFSLPIIKVMGDSGENVTVITLLEIGKSAPLIHNISIQNPVTLTANSTTLVNCTAAIEDFDTELDIKNVSAVFFHNNSAAYGDGDDNNTHYTNSSCNVSLSYGDGNQVLASCLYQIQYYAEPGAWNCSLTVNDYSGYQTFSSNITQIQDLLAVGLPSTISYGLVNATYVSGENITSIINYGNVALNLTLSGYAVEEGDNLAMNCTKGSIKNISVYYEQYNLTDSNPGALTLGEFDEFYENLSSSPETRLFYLDYNQNDTENDAQNSTYWRIYVPIGVAGSCSGNLIVGATQASE
jgi:hypothetical protein